jgi:hypothetical protein
MKMTVQLAASYVVGCRECAREVENMVGQAIRDSSVTGLSLKVAARCDHESGDQLTARMRVAPGGAAAPRNPAPIVADATFDTPTPLLQPTLPGVNSGLNGFDA